MRQLKPWMQEEGPEPSTPSPKPQAWAMWGALYPASTLSCNARSCCKHTTPSLLLLLLLLLIMQGSRQGLVVGSSSWATLFNGCSCCQSEGSEGKAAPSTATSITNGGTHSLSLSLPSCCCCCCCCCCWLRRLAAAEEGEGSNVSAHNC